MNLSEISKLPTGSYFVNDPAKRNFNPLGWGDYISIHYGSKHRQVRRSTAFNLGLCEGVKGQLPPQPQSGGFKEGCGRKPEDPENKKVATKIWLQQKTVDLFGGREALQKKIHEYLKTQI